MFRRVLRNTSRTSFVPVFSTRRHQSGAPPPRQPLHINENFVSGGSAAYLEELAAQYAEDPASVDPSWHPLLDALKDGSYPQPSPLMPEPMHTVSPHEAIALLNHNVDQSLDHSRRVTSFIQAHESHGHIFAQLDPVGADDHTRGRIPLGKITELSLDFHKFGLVDADYEKKFAMGFHDGVGGLFDATTPPMTLREIHQRLERAYMGTIGWQFTHVYDRAVQRWVREHVETPERVPGNPVSHSFTKDEHKTILRHLADAVLFEETLKRKHGTLKRFGLDGGESLIVGLKALIHQSAVLHGVEEFVIGIAHRGRLNTLANICGKPRAALFKEFKGLNFGDIPDNFGQGDVKYHLGACNELAVGKKTCRVNLMFNPSHLEAVNPVTQGYCRAALDFRNDLEGRSCMPIEIHGDASFAGQGTVYETMGAAHLGSYSTKGTVHVVVNNQIGYTTEPVESRSSSHCADIARAFQCPIFHVNGDRPEDVHRVFQMAANFRREFGHSCVIDLVCYRRMGHNETDDPTMTQPLLYKKIHAMKNVLEIHSKRLVEKQYLEQEEVDAIIKESNDSLKEDYKAADDFDYKALLGAPRGSCAPQWENFKPKLENAQMKSTALPKKEFEAVGKALGHVPKSMELHQTVAKIRAERAAAFANGVMDYPAAEELAFASLAASGVPCRLSGQDVQRGTFSQRHWVLHDQKTDDLYTPLENISKSQAPVCISNSSLSEFGIVGFELGYSAYHPNSLVVWEAQFGDFANGAQIIFDQFAHAGRAKWNVHYHPIISLPHGYEGQGPEHSSARLERFLQQTSEDDAVPNMSEVERHYAINHEVIVPTVPSQIFHAYRRHVMRNFRRPLFVFCSKARLKAVNDAAGSPLCTIEDFTEGGFRPVIGDNYKQLVPDDKVRKVVFMSGALYFHLEAERLAHKVDDVALVRIEQLAPFPHAEVAAQLAKYPNAEVVWAQDEPQNMGAFEYVEPRLLNHLKEATGIKYVGRAISATPATGYLGVHQGELEDIKKRCFA